MAGEDTSVCLYLRRWMKTGGADPDEGPHHPKRTTQITDRFCLVAVITRTTTTFRHPTKVPFV